MIFEDCGTLLVVLLMSTFASGQDSDICPEGLQPVKNICMKITKPSTMKQATHSCYSDWTRYHYTLNQLKTIDYNLFHAIKKELMKMGINEVWVEAQEEYPGGKFISDYPENSLFNTLIQEPITESSSNSGSCISLNLSSNALAVKDCVSEHDYLPAVCLAPQARLITTGACPEHFFSVPSFGKYCFHMFYSSDEKLKWGKVNEMCSKFVSDTGSASELEGYTTFTFASVKNKTLGVKQCPRGVLKVSEDSGTERFIVLNGTEPLFESYHLIKDFSVGSQPHEDDLLTDSAASANRDTESYHHCIQCRASLPQELPVNLTLMYEPEINILSVTVDHLERIVPQIRCFTDAAGVHLQSTNPTFKGSNKMTLPVFLDGYYWCVAKSSFDFKCLTSNKILVRKKETNFGLTTPAQVRLPQKTAGNERVIVEMLNNVTKGWGERRIIVKRIGRDNSTVLFHINRLPDETLGEVRDGLEKRGLIVDFVRDMRFCFKEEDGKETRYEIGKRVTTKVSQGCIVKEAVCEEDFNVGANWKDVDHSCLTTPKPAYPNDHSKQLLPESFSSADDILEKKLEKDNITINDLIHGITVINGALENEGSMGGGSAAAGYSPDLLPEASYPPSNVLKNLDKMLSRVDLRNNKEPVKILRSQIAVLILDSSHSKNKVVGFCFKSPKEATTLALSDIDVLLNEHDSNIDTSDMSVLFSGNMIGTEFRASFAVFNDDKAFKVSSTGGHVFQVNSKIVSVIVEPKSGNSERSFVDIVIKPKDAENKHKQCAFWKFTSSGGEWSTEGCELLPTKRNGLDVCRCNHLTHFAEIISDGVLQLSDANILILDVISIVGCILSILGLLGIAITAIAVRQWRARLEIKVLLNQAAGMAFVMIVFMIIATGSTKGGGTFCITIGALLHYFVLASFSWMMVSARVWYLLLCVLQRPEETRFMRIAMLFAWGIPIFPVLILMCLDPDLYTTQVSDKQESAFCYPRGAYFYLTVIFPISVVISCNFALFVLIINNIFHIWKFKNEPQLRRHSASERKRALRTVVEGLLLFFLFGLTWIFGLIQRSAFSAYVFCILSTLQGFVVFIFFVVGNKMAWQFWVNLGTKFDSWKQSTQASPHSSNAVKSQSTQSVTEETSRE